MSHEVPKYVLTYSHTSHSHTWWTFLKMWKQMKTTSSCIEWHPQTLCKVFIGPSSNLIVLSLYDKTLSIINKPKHPALPPKGRKPRNKMKGFRVWCLFFTKRANKILLATKVNNRILAIGYMVKIRSKRIKFLDLSIVSHNNICFLYVQIFVNLFSWSSCLQNGFPDESPQPKRTVVKPQVEKIICTHENFLPLLLRNC